MTHQGKWSFIGKSLAYIRVSSIDQNIDRQKEVLSAYNIDKYFIDKVTGSKLARPALDSLLEYSRDGDCVYITSIDRLARDLHHLKFIVDTLVKKQVKLHFIKENLIFNGDDTPLSKLLLHVIGAISEFERTLIKERQREGIEIAKKAGKYKGKPRKHTDEVIKRIMLELKTTRITKSALSKKYKISRTQLYKYIAEYKDNDLEYQTDIEEFC